jgi:hypothetical protein
MDMSHELINAIGQYGAEKIFQLNQCHRCGGRTYMHIRNGQKMRRCECCLHVQPIVRHREYRMRGLLV